MAPDVLRRESRHSGDSSAEGALLLNSPPKPRLATVGGQTGAPPTSKSGPVGSPRIATGAVRSPLGWRTRLPLVPTADGDGRKPRTPAITGAPLVALHDEVDTRCLNNNSKDVDPLHLSSSLRRRNDFESLALARGALKRSHTARGSLISGLELGNRGFRAPSHQGVPPTC